MDLFKERDTFFVDVIVPVPIPNLYSYRVPFELNQFVKVGQRVVVQFGRSKLVTAIIANIHKEVPQYTVKYIDYILDEHPVVNTIQLKLWNWMASYYMCTIGEVMTAALPSRFKLASETKILLNDNYERENDRLSDQEFLILDALELRGVLDLKEIGEILEIKTVYPIVKRLLDKDAIVLEEEIKEMYKPKMVAYVSLNPAYQSEEDLKNAFELIGKQKKQEELLLLYLNLSDFFNENVEVKKKELMLRSGFSDSVLKSLIKKEVLTIDEKEESRLKKVSDSDLKEVILSPDQNSAYAGIQDSFLNKDICLLHGITGSGKTEIYIKLMQDTIANGKKVLYLLPEIALTTQIITRLQKYFGSKIGVYHSKFSPNERVEIWNDVLEEKLRTYDIILGARSAVFLPFSELGLVIIDEEHETSFKQSDPAPRYNGRDVAIKIAKTFNTKILLGSATPSLEYRYLAEQDKIGYVSLDKRYHKLPLPEIFCADLLADTKKNKTHGIFSDMLYHSIKEALTLGEQIILFQNRRGYAPRWMCEDCNYRSECTRCDISLTYHKFDHILSCHYCGLQKKPPHKCPDCGSTKLKMSGVGTQKIEEEVEVHFGDKVVVQRMDLDTTRNKYAYENIIRDFEERKIDILVGTQMVSKGLDFDNVNLVGVLNADDLLYYPDFRAFERAYQLLSQVSGRAGRKNKRGKVVLQTYDPHHWILQKVSANDYQGMYRQELQERKQYHYPPFFKVIKLTVRHKLENHTDKASLMLANALKEKLGNRVLGPEYTAIKRIRNQYNKYIMVKFESSASPSKVKGFVQSVIDSFAMDADFKSVRIITDVDPS